MINLPIIAQQLKKALLADKSVENTANKQAKVFNSDGPL